MRRALLGLIACLWQPMAAVVTPPPSENSAIEPDGAPARAATEAAQATPLQNTHRLVNDGLQTWIWQALMRASAAPA